MTPFTPQRPHFHQSEALSERNINASDVIRRLETNLAKVQGITLYMQPVQNITVDDRVTARNISTRWKIPTSTN